MPRIVPLHQLLKEGVEKRVFPGAVSGLIYRGRTYILSAGYASLTPFLEPMEEDFLFDLASLTKPLALGLTLIHLLEEDPSLDLGKPLGAYLEVEGTLGEIPLYRFLNHTSGLKAWYPFYKEGSISLESIFQIIKELSLEFSPGAGSLYSDLNFYLLTYFLEKRYGEPFERLFEKAKARVSMGKRAHLLFKPLEKGIDQEKVVPTSVAKERGKILRGVVEDENTRALGGVSGVAGLFGNIFGVLDLLLALLLSYQGKGPYKEEIVKHFFEFEEPISEFSLAFMKSSTKGYSATGGAFSAKTVGHLGYTGCSFFLDLERELIVVLLTNRVHPHRGNEKIRDFRPLFHQKVVECLEA